MNGLDFFLAESLESIIIKKLGKRPYAKVKNRLLNKYGISLSQGMQDFQKVDGILRELFGSATDKFEKELVKNILNVDQSNKIFPIIITDPSLVNKTLLSYGDQDKKMIVDFLLQKPRIILDMVNDLDIPQATIYRRVKELIKDGLLMIAGYETGYAKEIPKYAPLFEDVRINLFKNNMNMSVRVIENTLKTSKFYDVLDSVHSTNLLTH